MYARHELWWVHRGAVASKRRYASLELALIRHVKSPTSLIENKPELAPLARAELAVKAKAGT